MELPGFKKTEGGMLDGIKSKLGFGTQNANDDYAGEFDEYAEGFDEYAQDYDDFGAYDGAYGEEPASDYEPYAPVSTRSVRSASSPKLISIDDVRAARSTSSSSLGESPLSSYRGGSSSSFGGNRELLDSSLPPVMTPEGTAALSAAASRRSDGLDSLFEPTTSADDASAAASLRGIGAAGASSAGASSQGASSGFDPYEAYSGTGASRYSTQRSLTVIKPASYGEVEKVARALKAGDLVVLALRNTPDALVKRILDFSFGVASALDASVDCVGDKVFAISRGEGLSDAERSSLRNQGVL